jgi:hypothetical protein
MAKESDRLHCFLSIRYLSEQTLSPTLQAVYVSWFPFSQLTIDADHCLQAHKNFAIAVPR